MMMTTRSAAALGTALNPLAGRPPRARLPASRRRRAAAAAAAGEPAADPRPPHDAAAAAALEEHAQHQATAEAAAPAAAAAAAEAEAAVAAPPPLPPPPAGALGALRERLDLAHPAVRLSVLGAAAFAAATFAVAVVRVAARSLGPGARRGRTVSKNKAVVDALAKYLPGNRAGLGPAAVAALRLRTGFSPTEIFRKFLWYVLRERPFDQAAVDDLAALAAALGLGPAEVAAALRERARRVYDKYGAVMLDATGMTQAGLERKATARALFSKMLFLAECEELGLAQPEPAGARGGGGGGDEGDEGEGARAAAVDLRDIFGATEDDAARLRIVSLREVDLERAAALPDAPEGGGGGGGSGSDAE